MNNTSMTKREDQRLENVAERPATAPRVDVFEGKDEVLLVADMAGVGEESLRVNLDDEQLTIEGRPDEEGTGTALQREFRLFDYRRSFLIPSGIDRSKISAELKEGVLWLRLPKSDALKPRRIEIKAG
jgi:HSP20 family molecular chaperone IbpA